MTHTAPTMGATNHYQTHTTEFPTMNTIALAGHAGRISGTAARFTYDTGYLAGSLWHQHAAPIVAQIDWAEVRAIVRDGLAIVAAAVWAAATLALPTIETLSAHLGRWYVAALGLETAPAPAPAPKAPRIVATAAGLTVAQLRVLAREAGQPRSFVRVARKAELLAVLGY